MKKLSILCIILVIFLLPVHVLAIYNDKKNIREEINTTVNNFNNNTENLNSKNNIDESSVIISAIEKSTSLTMNTFLSIEQKQVVKQLLELKKDLSQLEAIDAKKAIDKKKEEENKKNNIISSDKITWIGDSYTIMAKNKILEKLPNCDIYAKGSKHFQMDVSNNPSGISILKDIVTTNKLREYLVFALSTNDPINSENTFNNYIDQVIKLANDSTIIFITPYTKNYKNGKINYDTQIKLLKDAENKYDNVRCAKWDEVCNNKIDKYFSNDSIHPNSIGLDAWVNCIIDQLYTQENITANTSSKKINYSWNGTILNRSNGTVQGPSGKETYYNMDMSNIVSCLENRSGWLWNDIKKHGNTKNISGKYWIREDGCKMFGNYIMVAAKLSTHPRGSLVETSLGTGVVVDTGGFANSAQGDRWIDIATNW